MSVLPERLQMKRDHRWARRRLSDYLDDELTPAERRRLERHADICPECGPLLRALTVTVFRLRQLRFRRPGSVAPRVVAPRVIDRLRAEEARR